MAVSECFKLGIRWTDYIYDTDAVAFKKITEKCDIKPWSFADKGKDKESDADADAPNAVKISLKATLTEDESNTTRTELFDILERAHERYKGKKETAIMHLSNEILLLQTIVGYVIGKQGGTLRNIKNKTGVDLIFVDDNRRTDKDSPPEGIRRLVIKGSSVKSVREARENIKHLLKLANNIIRSNGGAKHQNNATNLASTTETRKRASSVESVFDSATKVAPKHPNAPEVSVECGNFVAPKQPPVAPSDATNTTTAAGVSQAKARNSFGTFSNNSTQIGHQQQQKSPMPSESVPKTPTNVNIGGFGRSRFKEPSMTMESAPKTPTNVNIGGFGHSRFKEPSMMIPRISHHEGKTSAKVNGQATKMNGIQQNVSDETRHDETNGEEDACTPAKKRRTSSSSGINGHGSGPLQDCIKRISECISDCWMAHVRRLEEENYLLKMKLSKYKELRNAKELKNRASANAMEKEDGQCTSAKDRCIECKTAKRNTVFAFCGHLLYCHTCAEKFSECKVCGKPASDKILIDQRIVNLG